MADLQKFQADLVAEHNKLMQDYEAKHKDAEAKWTASEEAANKLTAFRASYWKVLQALKDGAVKVEG